MATVFCSAIILHLYCSNLDMKNAHILLPDGYNWFKSRVWTKLVLGIQIYRLVYKKGALVFQVTLFKETNNILITDHEIKEDQKEVYFLYKPIQISLLVYLFDFYCTLRRKIRDSNQHISKSASMHIFIFFVFLLHIFYICRLPDAIKIHGKVLTIYISSYSYMYCNMFLYFYL